MIVFTTSFLLTLVGGPFGSFELLKVSHLFFWVFFSFSSAPVAPTKSGIYLRDHDGDYIPVPSLLRMILLPGFLLRTIFRQVHPLFWQRPRCRKCFPFRLSRTPRLCPFFLFFYDQREGPGGVSPVNPLFFFGRWAFPSHQPLPCSSVPDALHGGGPFPGIAITASA